MFEICRSACAKGPVMSWNRISWSILVVCGWINFAPATLWAENWPRFRGPSGQGMSAERNLPLHWSDTENVAWKTPIPGEGWSSPVIWDDRIFLTSTTDEGRSCHVLCVDRRTGEILWNKEVFQQTPRFKRPDNSYATPTPTTDGQRVFVAFSSGGIAALDMEGNLQWQNHDISFFSQHGLGASPILYGDFLIMPFDGSSPEEELIGFKRGWDGAVLLALDKNTGKPGWRGSRGLSRLAHVTPNVLEVDGQMQLVSAAGDVVQGHRLDNGERIWTVRSQGEGVTPSIVFGDGLIYTCSGFEAPTIRAIRTGGVGDVTNTHIAWEQKRGVPAIASLIYVAPHVYSVTDQGVVNCFDAQTGAPVWQHRIGGKHWSSPISAEGRIYFLSPEGETAVIAAGPEYKELARNSLGELCRASIGVSQGQLFIRTEHNLFCIGEATAQN
jgi:outer membrane protein assembly factor BamB